MSGEGIKKTREQQRAEHYDRMQAEAMSWKQESLANTRRRQEQKEWNSPEAIASRAADEALRRFELRWPYAAQSKSHKDADAASERAKHPGGRVSVVDWVMYTGLIKAECARMGLPGPDNVPEWKSQADVIRFIRPSMRREDPEPSEAAMKRHVSKILKDLGWKARN